MPTDIRAVVTKREDVEHTYPAVILTSEERIIFRKERGGYALLLTWSLCPHHHRSVEKAFLCKKARSELALAIAQSEARNAESATEGS